MRSLRHRKRLGGARFAFVRQARRVGTRVRSKCSPRHSKLSSRRFCVSFLLDQKVFPTCVLLHRGVLYRAVAPLIHLPAVFLRCTQTQTPCCTITEDMVLYSSCTRCGQMKRFINTLCFGFCVTSVFLLVAIHVSATSEVFFLCGTGYWLVHFKTQNIL